ncbi:MAG: thioredoxin-disulfide reductase [Treponemataceae bacterium]|nr:MAG: thioredoxin-disulfide reductase [Treponemataceae bacterium]
MHDYDFIIIGSGIAGLTAALYAGRSGLSTAVIEQGGSGGQALNITELENYPGIRLTNGSALSETLTAQARDFGAHFVNTVATRIEKNAALFTVTTDDGIFAARSVLLATGASPKKLGLTGEDEFLGAGVSYCATCDGPFFKNKHVAVIGGGNSACAEALYLASIASGVTLIHRRGILRAEKYVADKVRAHRNITVLLETQVTQIVGTGRVESISLSNGNSLSVDGVFIFAGLDPQIELAAALPLVQKDDAGYIITDENMQTGLAGFFAAGDVRSKSLRQLVTAASDGATAAHAALGVLL